MTAKLKSVIQHLLLAQLKLFLNIQMPPSLPPWPSKAASTPATTPPGSPPRNGERGRPEMVSGSNLRYSLVNSDLSRFHIKACSDLLLLQDRKCPQHLTWYGQQCWEHNKLKTASLHCCKSICKRAAHYPTTTILSHLKMDAAYDIHKYWIIVID